MPDYSLLMGAAAPVLGKLFGGSKGDKNAGKVDLTTTSSQSTDATSMAMDAQGREVLSAFLSQLMNQQQGVGAGFTKSAAVADSDAAMSAAINKVLAQGMGQAMAGELASGGYNSSYGAFARNDLAAEAASAGAQVRLGTVQNYGQLFQNAQTQFMQQLLGALQLNAQANQSQSQSSSSTQTQKGFDKRGVSSGAGGGLNAADIIKSFVGTKSYDEGAAQGILGATK